MFASASREFRLGVSSSRTKSELSAGNAKVIAIIWARDHGVGEAGKSPTRTWRMVRLSAEGDGSGGGEYSGGASGASERRNSSARVEGKSMTTVSPLTSTGALDAGPPAGCAGWTTLSAIRSR